MQARMIQLSFFLFWVEPRRTLTLDTGSGWIYTREDHCGHKIRLAKSRGIYLSTGAVTAEMETWDM